ncbi:right-handed parallel beta-helix repeat-containing protein [Micromonospora sp. C28SCA-DRY-2]|uniref:right-handed parallel beta-helix repeat-containing protein n=1 Tax=Micromonospora sp. C28SCA-DRY-2 TaxID=3059522 RepID=UPI00267612F4|nr:right-handed parallel beta-helix repeat-containing protein [Micromonospora sp. C28SCA-DRY-2]MDO3703433.1 right-handed parallel beta-helix repeat-containing protein [Micromonospora sp. C28SCA-DRY-2]
MSTDETTPDGTALTGPPNRGRRKLWVAAGVAGLTGIVGLAALGGIAARDDSSGGSDRPDARSDARQNVSDAGKADGAGDGKGESEAGKRETGKGEDDWSGANWSGQEDRRDDKGKAKDVPCHTDKLIQAIVHANENHGGVLELAKGCTYELTRSERGNGLPVIKEKIVLRGHDTKIVRAAAVDRFRILNVGRGGHLTLKDVTIKGGQTEARKMVPQPMSAAEFGGSTQVAPAPAARPAMVAPRPAVTAAPQVSVTPSPGPGGGPALASPDRTPTPAPDLAPTQPPLDAADGAGLLVQRGGQADIEHSVFVQNQAGGNGGGIANYGTTNIRKSSVEHNTAGLFGGGLFNAGVLRVEESKVDNNTAGEGGGGIANGTAPNGFPATGGTVWVWKGTISHNRTAGLGGGVFDNGGDTTITQSRITDNTGTRDVGGVIAFRDTKLSLEHVLVANNHTAGEGGGVGVGRHAHAVIEQSVIKENVAEGFGGGGVYTDDLGSTTLRDTEVVANRAVGLFSVGGGIVNDFGRTTLIRTKVTHNVATQPPGGIWTNNDRVDIDDKSAVKDNRPTNCQGSPVIPDNCFG